MDPVNDTADMRQTYFVPDRFSDTLSDRSGAVYFRNGRGLPEDISLRVFCNLVCRMLQAGLSWENSIRELNVEDEQLLYEKFTAYTGMTPENYSLWTLNHQKK